MADNQLVWGIGFYHSWVAFDDECEGLPCLVAETTLAYDDGEEISIPADTYEIVKDGDFYRCFRRVHNFDNYSGLDTSIEKPEWRYTSVNQAQDSCLSNYNGRGWIPVENPPSNQ